MLKQKGAGKRAGRDHCSRAGWRRLLYRESRSGVRQTGRDTVPNLFKITNWPKW